MIRRAVILAPARGYVDGKYIGEEKEANDSVADSRRGAGRRGKPADGRRGKGGGDGNVDGNTTRAPKRGRSAGATGTRPPASGKRPPRGAGTERAPRAAGVGAAERGTRRPPRGAERDPSAALGGVGLNPKKRGRKVNPSVAPNPNFAGDNRGNAAGNSFSDGNAASTRGQGRPAPRKARPTKKTPFRAPAPKALISEVAENRRQGEEVKSGQFAEALAASQNVKRERLHKILAQSGHGSRRDMEILIASGRLMVNGIVATAGTQVAAGDNVLLDHRPIKLKFTEDLPRILLYHKPEGEIVTTNDPGNRITVFDNLPKVENGKWTAIGRLDINTSGLLIFTTNGELANRFMHPRYEIEREYAVRVLGELKPDQQQRLLDGVMIDDGSEEGEESAPARFDSIEKRGGEGANQWYQVTIKEGRNREVRKMFEAIGLTVSRLIRTRFGPIALPPRLVRGKMIELGAPQVLGVMSAIGLNADGTAAGPPPVRRKEVGPRPKRAALQGERGNQTSIPDELDLDQYENQPLMLPHEEDELPEFDGNRITHGNLESHVDTDFNLDSEDDMIGNTDENAVANAARVARAEQDRRGQKRNRRGMLGRGERRAGNERRERDPNDPPAFIPVSDIAFRELASAANGNRGDARNRNRPPRHSADGQRPPRPAQDARPPRPPREQRPPRSPLVAEGSVTPGSHDVPSELGKGRRTFRRRRGGGGGGGRPPPSTGGNA